MTWPRRRPSRRRTRTYGWNDVAPSAADLPPRLCVLRAATLLAATLGGIIVGLTAVGIGQADVRGLPLRGALRLAFLTAGGLPVVATAVAGAALRPGRVWGVRVLTAVPPFLALVCLGLDGASPAPGAGRPLAFYVLGVGLLPTALIHVLARTGRRRGE